MPASHLGIPDYRNDIDSFSDDEAPEVERWQRRAAVLIAWAAPLAAASSDNTSRWLEVNMPRNRQNARRAKKIYKRALRLSLAPLLMSCGSGGYRLVIVFDRPVAIAHLHALGKRLVRGMHGRGAVNLLPQQNDDTFRLPDCTSKVRAGKTWLSGVDALRVIANTVGVSPDLLTANDGKAGSKSPVQAGQRPVCVEKSSDVEDADEEDIDADEDAQPELFEIPRPVSFDDDDDEKTAPQYDVAEEKVTRHPFWLDTNSRDGGGVFVPKWVISVVDEGTEMLLLAQLNYWFRPGKDGRLRARLKRDDQVWVAKTYDELGAEIGRTSRQVQTAVKGLQRKRILVAERHRSPVHYHRTVTHFRLDWAALKSAHVAGQSMAKASEPAAKNGW